MRNGLPNHLWRILRGQNEQVNAGRAKGGSLRLLRSLTASVLRGPAKQLCMLIHIFHLLGCCVDRPDCLPLTLIPINEIVGDIVDIRPDRSCTPAFSGSDASHRLSEQGKVLFNVGC